MAKDVITRFKLETTAYDSKLRDATKGLSDFAKTATAAGKEFGKFTQENVEAARAIGNISPSANNAKDKVKELVTAYNELVKAYSSLTKEQQQSDFGKAMADSLGKLKTQIAAAKQELYGMGDAMKDATKGFLSGDKLSGMLQVFGGNVMTKAAGMAAQFGTELVSCVQQGVELARQGEGIRVAFERLGRGDILQGLRDATHGTVTDLELMKAAVKFNDFKLPLDQLGTLLAFAQQKAKDTGQSVDYMVDSIVTGLGRKSLMILDNLGLSAAQVKERMAETGDMTKAVADIIKEEMSKSGDYVETAADRAQQATVAQQNKMEELGRKIMPLAEESASMWNSIKIGGLSVIANVLDPMISKFTHLGRLMAAQGMSSNGGGGSMNRMIGMLGTGQGENARSTYNRQVAAFNRSINARRADVTAVERWQGGERSQGLQETINRLRDKYGADFQRVVRDNLNATINNLNEYKKRAQQLMSSAAVTSPVSDTTPTGKTGGTRSASSPSRQQTEMQQNQTRINELTQQYVTLMASASEAGKPLTDEQQKQTAEIQRQISELEKRNGLLKLYEEQAHGRLMGVDVMTSGLSMTGGFTGLATPQSMSDVVRERGGNLLDDKAMKALNKEEKRNEKKEDKEQKSVVEGIDQLNGGINNIFGGLEQIGIEIPTELKSIFGVVQGVTTILMGIASTIIAIEALVGADTFLPFAKGGIVPKFAEGGIVPKFADGGLVGRAALGMTIPGNSFSGDNLRMPVVGGGMIGVNSGEVILNRAQAGVIASELQGSGMQNMHLDAVISGEQIRLVLNNNGRRTGRGEYVQSTRRR